MPEYVSASPADVRGPCPALNSLANHGYLPRNGQEISAEMLLSAIKQVFHMDASPLLGSVFKGKFTVDLDDLAEHGHSSLEHDVSLTRHDHALGLGHAVVPELVEALISESRDGQFITADDIAAFRAQRWKEAERNNFNLDFGLPQQVTACVETSVALNVLGRNGKIPIDHVLSFLLEERIPDNYIRPVKEIPLASIQGDTVAQLARMHYRRATMSLFGKKRRYKLPVDTRDFSLETVPSVNIEEHITPGNTRNMDPRTPEQWHGIFYMDGNPVGDECFSLASTFWSNTEDCLIVPIYAHDIWVCVYLKISCRLDVN
ncbi:hypothetical protein BC830DRAFT_1069046 [Chytriomyces sp. MP71]|nr:hypothetical protein BC830DRAFT_1069046 [Chytriomyces sp. MP71]